MHKDTPPGIFDFPRRSVTHGVGVGLIVGILLSAVAHLGLLIWRADANGTEPPRAGAEAAARVMSKHKTPPTNPTPGPSAAVDY